MRNCGLKRKSPLHFVSAIHMSPNTDYCLSNLRHSGHSRKCFGPKLHRFDCICCNVGCITYRQRMIKWSLSIIFQICGNNGQHSNLLSTDARCLVIIFCWPCSMVDFYTARRYAKCGICRCRVSVRLSVCLCVCVSVCLSHSVIVSKWLNIGLRK